MNTLRILLGLLSVFPILTSLAQSRSGWSASLTHENDVLSLNDKGENYTGSMRLEVLLPQTRPRLIPFLRPKDPNTIDVLISAIGAAGFVPQNPFSSDVDTEDRPYGSFAYLGSGHIKYNLEKGRITRSELQLGSIGGSIWSGLHRGLTKAIGARPEPMGWGNQVGAPGSAAVNLSFAVSQDGFHSGQIFMKYFLENIHLEHDTVDLADSELIHVDTVMKDKQVMKGLSHLLVAETGFEFFQTNWLAGGNVGTCMDNIYVGAEFDLFNINRYALLNYIPESIRTFGPLHATHHKHGTRDLIRFNVFVRPMVKAVGYNAMLEGLLFKDKSALVIGHGDISRILFEIDAGFNLLINHRVSLIGTWSGRTREYKGGRSFNSWGGLTIGYSPARWNQ